MTETSTIRATIAASRSKIVRIDAIAKCGTVKRFVFSAAANRTHVLGAATAAGAQATATRKANNPDLVSVYCFIRRRWASFDLSQVVAMRARGTETVFRAV